MATKTITWAKLPDAVMGVCRGARFRGTILLALVLIITVFHFATSQSEHYQHIFYQELYFLPLILAAFWFGLKGAISTSLCISLVYLPFIALHWTHFSPEDFSRLVSVALFNVIAVTLGLLRDREQAEQARRSEAACLETMGRALSAAAHDMKTPLVAIGGFSHLVQKRLSECKCRQSDYCAEKLGIISQETQRLENLVKEMLDFSRPLELSRAARDIDQVIRESITIAEPLAQGKNVVICYQPSCAPLRLPIDIARMKQALINVMTNAVQASAENQNILVKCYRENRDIRIDIVDHGCGIPEEKREQIFLPFYTTKRGGSGLGLPITKKIIEAHQGRLEILDNPDGGVTSRITLPAWK